MSQPIRVVSGLLFNQHGHLLLTQRDDRSDFPFRLEIPGGKQETGEDHVQTLSREFFEENGISICPECLRAQSAPCWRGAFDERHGCLRPVEISFYRVHTFGQPRPSALQVAGFVWMDPSILNLMALLSLSVRPEARPLVPSLAEAFARTPEWRKNFPIESACERKSR